ncbi:YlbF family regulator [Bacillus piscicola]|uniref:YlbF family regulator n=1 Tax=Bacillus piscicola TaxID=1632684 RepID=UPI001F09FBB5|nr:YlbF family regulator [Bacillus piscicola]
MSAVISTSADLLEEAASLGEFILESEVFIHYQTAREHMRNDQEAQRLITEFNKMKDHYEDVQRFGKYHPDYKTITREVRSIKREMDMHETIATFKKAERELEMLLNQISAEITGVVSPTIKVPTGNPHFDASCGGGCGTGNKCGCS